MLFVLHDVNIINVLCINSYSFGAQNSTLYTINAFVRRSPCAELDSVYYKCVCAQVTSNFHSTTRDEISIASRVVLWNYYIIYYSKIIQYCCCAPHSWKMEIAHHK